METGVGPVKYPRTYHLPWSPGKNKDDKVLSSVGHFIGKKVVITVKMDGENTSIHKGGYHARSMDSAYHPSRSYVAALWGRVSHLMPEGMRICGENLYARHSIAYESLESYFLGFSVWDRYYCMPWDETLDCLRRLNICHVPVVYCGTWDEGYIRRMFINSSSSAECEGYVIRLSEGFEYKDFYRSVAKYVRAGHVQTDDHWMYKEIVKNGLKGKDGSIHIHS